jgi:AcrR family transcriptional regulator
VNAVPYREAARQLLRETLLDAARSLLSERPWAQITMADIASRAGVSRQTLYNELGGREQFVQAFVIREAQRFIGAVRQAIEAHLDDPAAALAAALELFLDTAGRDPLIGMLLDDDGTGGMLPLITTRSRPVLDWAGQQIAEAITEGWPMVAEQDASLLAQTLVRLAISYLTVPIGPPSQATQDAVRLLSPFIERAVVQAAGQPR